MASPLSPLNALVEGGQPLPGDLWREWLWRCDPEEPVHARVLLNRSHLCGLLVCRQQAAAQGGAGAGRAAPPCADERMTLMAKHPSEMTLRELRDTVDNVLIEWPAFLHRLEGNPDGSRSLGGVLRLVDACFARFGRLASRGEGLATMDDPTSVEEHDDGTARLNRTFLRRMLGTFLVLYRHFHLLCKAEPVAPEPYACEIGKHHLEASNDDFHALCMHMRLPVAGRLNYKHDFPGMYNHVSQAVYFHNPKYERIPRVPIDRVCGGEPVQVLPAIQQIHPEIPVRYEEDVMDLSEGSGAWFWVVLPGRVYLVGPDARVYHSPNVTALLRVYREARG